MVMTAQQSMHDYWERASKLVEFFFYNHRRAAGIVEDSPVDYPIHKFICSTLQYESRAILLLYAFGLRDLYRDDNYAYEQRLIEQLHSLEETLATQNEFLDLLASRYTALAER